MFLNSSSERTALAVCVSLAVTVPAAFADEMQAPVPSGADQREPEWYSLHIQGTYTTQGHPRFRSAIPDGAQSMQSRREMAETADVTLFAGVRLGDLELYANPEMDQGFGPSETFGVGGYTTGESYKVGEYSPYVRLPRLFARYVVGLGGERVAVEDGPNQLGGDKDSDNITVTIGKFSVVDIFDANTYAHDPKADFLNWSIIEMGAFDYAAESWGFTYGAAAEWTQDWWTLRAGVFDMSRQPNDKYLDRGFGQYQSVVEAEERHAVFGNPGKVKALFFLTSAKQGLYSEAVALAPQTGGTPDTSAVVRHRLRPGGGINVEQQILPDLGAFLRASMNDGTTAEFDFTDINRSVSGGVSLKGERWGRPDDILGLGGAVNAISHQARQYFAAGGMGGLVGDGQLPSYSPERIVEAYYKATIVPGIALTLDYQHMVNPGYDTVRGPIDFYAFRLHGEY